MAVLVSYIALKYTTATNNHDKVLFLAQVQVVHIRIIFLFTQILYICKAETDSKHFLQTVVKRTERMSVV